MAALIPAAMAGIASLANGVKSRKQKSKSKSKSLTPSVNPLVRRLAPSTGLMARKHRKSRSQKGAPGYASHPLNYGTTIGASRLSFNVGKPLPSAEFSANEGIRIHGSGLLSPANITVGGGTANNGVFTTSYPNVLAISPASIDPRLNNMSRCFQQYAFRSIRFRYSPIIATNSTGSIALAMVRNADLIPALRQGTPSIGNNTQSTVLQFENSMLFQQATPAEMVYTHVGTETWQANINPGSADASETQQGFLLGAYSADVSVLTTLGSIWCEWVVDLYGLSAIVGSAPYQSKDGDSKDEKDYKSPSCDDVKSRSGTSEPPPRIKVVEGFHQPPPPLKRSDSTESLLTTEIRRAVRQGALAQASAAK